MNRFVAGLAGAVLLALAMAAASSASAQSILEATSGDAFYARGTGGVPPR